VMVELRGCGGWLGVGRAMELILTGKEIDAEEAYRIGLVNEVVPAERVFGESKRDCKENLFLPPGFF